MAPRIPSPSPASDRPDAVIYPRPTGARGVNEISDGTKEVAVEMAEHYLQCGPHELAWVRDQLRYLFATRNPEDSEFFPDGHERARQPRYRWRVVGVGVRIGWMVDA